MGLGSHGKHILAQLAGFNLVEASKLFGYLNCFDEGKNRANLDSYAEMYILFSNLCHM